MAKISKILGSDLQKTGHLTGMNIVNCDSTNVQNQQAEKKTVKADRNLHP